jgi:DNA-binding LacI/PurR family transcriptional regulator
LSGTRPATIYDVAKLAGVSHQTVSLYLRGHQGFRESTRDRVEAALAELSYRPNLAAKSLATSRSHRLGALVYELTEVGPSKTIQGASDRARAAGYLLDIVNLDPTDDSAIDRALGQLGQQDLAGILAFAPVDLIAEKIAAVPFNVPVITEAEREDAHDAPPDGINRPGLDLIVDHLVSLGHRRFFHLAGPADWVASRNRLTAYEDALARHGALSVGSIAGDWGAASGHAAATAMPLDAGVTAVIAANDQMALGALLEREQRGVDVPGRMSVTGFDDIPESAFYRPPLTTVRVDYVQQGRVLVERLLPVIDPSLVATPEATTPPTLVVRSSTAPPAHSR